jgi:hypothetical protein
MCVCVCVYIYVYIVLTEGNLTDVNENIILALVYKKGRVVHILRLSPAKCNVFPTCNIWNVISSSHGGEYDVQNCLLGCTAV